MSDLENETKVSDDKGKKSPRRSRRHRRKDRKAAKKQGKAAVAAAVGGSESDEEEAVEASGTSVSVPEAGAPEAFVDEKSVDDEEEKKEAQDDDDDASAEKEPTVAASSSAAAGGDADAESDGDGDDGDADADAASVDGDDDNDDSDDDGIGYDIVLDGRLPDIELQDDECEDDLEVMAEERELLVLLLHARQLLGTMLDKREEQDRFDWEEKRRLDRERAKASGEMSVQEIQDILQNQDFDEEGRDFVQQMQDLKAQLVIEIRRNHVLDRDVAKLDKKIALLIKNRGNIEALSLKKDQGKASSSKSKRANTERVEVSPRQLANYQDLFYLLQTQPRYLARMVYMVSPEQMDTFMDTTILTLYGDAFSPREEFLILRLFQLAIQHEISVIKNVGDFLTVDTVVPKMVITYNRRKAGFAYLKSMLREPMKEFLSRDINMELKPQQVYAQMINEAEIRTGERSTLKRDVTAEEAMENADVNRIVTERLDALRDVCSLFLQAILRTRDQLPYGLRWICKQLRELIQKALPDSTHDDILKLTGYFVYYRFINVALVNPDAKTRDQQIIKEEVPPLQRRAIATVSRVMQNLFNFRPFGDDQPQLKPLNDFIIESKPAIAEYFDSLIKVPDPEDHLQVNTYMELTQKTKPVIQISLHEMFSSHSLIVEHLEQVAPEQDDPLRKIMQDLGESPPPDTISASNNRETQLTLTNRFKVDVEEDDPAERLYAETKELLIPILRKVPIQESLTTLSLLDVLESGIQYAKATENEDLNEQINKILENINQLEQEEMVTKDDNYESFVHDVAREVANRNAIRARQQKEIERLQKTLDSLRAHQKYLEDQIDQYQKYLNDCKKSFYAPTGKKASSSGASQRIGPFKFKYSELEKRGVIIDSEVPTLSRKRTTFSIVSEAPGSFEITAKIAGISVESMQLELEELLERHYNNITRLELDQVTLNVNMTLFLLNGMMKKKKK
jgi:Ras GTPase-activating-like protein IQGAP2/3